MCMHPKYMTGKVCLFGNANQYFIQTGSDKPYRADQIEKQGENFVTCYLGPSFRLIREFLIFIFWSEKLEWRLAWSVLYTLNQQKLFTRSVQIDWQVTALQCLINFTIEKSVRYFAPKKWITKMCISWVLITQIVQRSAWHETALLH